MTPYQVVYDAFLAKITPDEWTLMEDLDATLQDWRAILEGAIPYIKFPRESLMNRNDDGFPSDLESDTIQLLATYMKLEWFKRCIMTWENIQPMYDEQDFSPANRLDKLTKLLANVETAAAKQQNTYYRAIKEKPYEYNKLAGGK